MGRRITALFLVLLLGMNSLTAFASETDTAAVQAGETQTSETALTEEPEVSEPTAEITETEPVTEQETAPEDRKSVV